MQMTELKRLIRQSYKDCHSYQDSGWMSETKPGRQETAKRIEFSTRFIRPQMFRFDWLTYHPYASEATRSVIWSNGNKVFIQQSGSEREIAPSLIQGLKKLCGVSRSTSFYVPSLLFEGDKDSLDTNFTQMTDASFSDIDCYRLEAASEKEVLRMYIDKTQLLIRGISEEAEVDAAAIFDADTFAKVSSDLVGAGANPETVLSPFLSISEINYESVRINISIASEIFSEPS